MQRDAPVHPSILPTVIPAYAFQSLFFDFEPTREDEH